MSFKNKGATTILALGVTWTEPQKLTLVICFTAIIQKKYGYHTHVWLAVGSLNENVSHKLMCLNICEMRLVSLAMGTFETVRTQRQAPKACSSLGGVDRVLKAQDKDTQGRWRSRGLHRFWGLTVASWWNLFSCMRPQGCLSGTRILLLPLQQD